MLQDVSTRFVARNYEVICLVMSGILMQGVMAGILHAIGIIFGHGVFTETVCIVLAIPWLAGLLIFWHLLCCVCHHVFEEEERNW